jgi:hypothetical protein
MIGEQEARFFCKSTTTNRPPLSGSDHILRFSLDKRIASADTALPDSAERGSAGLAVGGIEKASFGPAKPDRVFAKQSEREDQAPRPRWRRGCELRREAVLSMRLRPAFSLAPLCFAFDARAESSNATQVAPRGGFHIQTWE